MCKSWKTFGLRKQKSEGNASLFIFGLNDSDDENFFFCIFQLRCFSILLHGRRITFPGLDFASFFFLFSVLVFANGRNATNG